MKKSKKPITQEKKSHTYKSMVITGADKVIKYLSLSTGGTKHDYRLLKELFPKQEDWFESKRLLADSGYTGIDKDYKSKSVKIPAKKPKNQPLSEESKQHNRELSSERIYVEHSIGGMKRYRILSNTLRTHDIDLYNSFLGICAGLWNFYLLN